MGREPHLDLRRALIAALLCSAGPAGFAACSGERAALLRGQAYYEDNQFERALSLWRDLERDEATLTSVEFARYAYLRGMTDYRLGFRSDARHWLALAKVTEQAHPGGLDGSWHARLDAALSDLDREAFGIPAGNTDSVQSIEAPSVDGPPAPRQLPLPPSAGPPSAGPPSAGPPSPQN
jgi:hypothetical protein